MRYRKLTEDDDYSFGASELDFYRDVPEAVGQAAKTRLLLWTGEWFLDIDEGTPYMLGVLGKHSIESANVTLQDRIQGTQGLVSIEDYTSTLDADLRKMSVGAAVNTIYGPTTLQVSNYANY